ncbi:MAG: hypothetical protein ACO3CH_00405 [Ilumatobacteraceae bacterium]
MDVNDVSKIVTSAVILVVLEAIYPTWLKLIHPMRYYGLNLIVRNFTHPFYLFFAFTLEYYAFVPVVVFRAVYEICGSWKEWLAYSNPEPF